MVDFARSSNNLANEELVELLSKYFAQRGQFLAQVIRADLQSMYHLNSSKNGNGNGNGTKKAVCQEIINSKAEIQPVKIPKPVQPIQPVTQASRNVEAILVDLVVWQTGYPRESIGLELKLLDDLNLDSIKAGELVAAAAKECGVAGQIDPSALANASLQEVAEIIHSAMPAVPALIQPAISVNHAAIQLQPQENTNWVRNFAVEYVAQAR
jgi:enediyne polyketide synthase